jgi:orotate phosphoribosyltransferase
MAKGWEPSTFTPRAFLTSDPLQSTLMTTPTHAQQLLSLLARLSFRLGQFKLSSGGTSDYYVDCRTTTLHAEGGRLTGHAILELLEQNSIDAEAVGGMTMGADPIVSNVATASAWRAVSHCCTVSSSAKRRRRTAPAAALRDSAAKVRAS